jgi:hypothetical protein
VDLLISKGLTAVNRAFSRGFCPLADQTVLGGVTVPILRIHAGQASSAGFREKMLILLEI